MRTTATTKKKSSRKHPTTKRSQTGSEVLQLLQKPQTILGILIVMSVVYSAIFLHFFGSAPTTQDNSNNSGSEVPATLLSGIVTDVADQATTSAAATEPLAATAAAQVASAAAETLQTGLKVRVKKDQTFWEFAKRYCGSHRFANSLASTNGYRLVSDLKEGDWITISCN
jgi:hypothetical protein